MQSRVSRGDTQGQENAGHFGPGLKAVRPHLLFSSLKAAAPSVLNCCVILPGQFSGQIPHLKSEMWAPRALWVAPTSQKRDVGHPAPWVAIPHLKGEMWGTRLRGSLSHISKARCGAPGGRGRSSLGEGYIGRAGIVGFPHLKSEMWGTRVCGCNPTSQRRDVGHPGLWVAIPHLKGEMWGTRLCGSKSHISKARCGAPGFVSYPGSYAVWRVRRRGTSR